MTAAVLVLAARTLARPGQARREENLVSSQQPLIVPNVALDSLTPKMYCIKHLHFNYPGST